ncbi:hypothetical protein SAMN02799630_04925 [Paenibacillus sp. UNCCL117]|nr:hypothetical protein SAMN04488602_12163 [Paenibacillus sp. cl123]SFW61821.1 hypothetical protein SAMN02799630_04925 [Paenibacillus sp. UNCCL117]
MMLGNYETVSMKWKQPLSVFGQRYRDLKSKGTHSCREIWYFTKNSLRLIFDVFPRGIMRQNHTKMQRHT